MNRVLLVILNANSRCKFCKSLKDKNQRCECCGIPDDNIFGAIADFSYNVKKATKDLQKSASKRHEDKEHKTTRQVPEINKRPLRFFSERFSSIFLIIAILLTLSYVLEEGYFDSFASFICFFKFGC